MASFDFDAFKDKAGDLVQSGINKSKEIMEITKLKVASRGEEDAIKKAYIEIGKLYYAERGMSPEAGYVALCEKITAAKGNVEDNKKRIEEIKSAGGISDDDIVVELPADEPEVEAAPAPEAEADADKAE